MREQQQFHFVAQSTGAHQLCRLLLGTYMLYGCILHLAILCDAVKESSGEWIKEEMQRMKYYIVFHIYLKIVWVFFLALFLDNLCYLTIHRL